jgi:hypothetical protein
MSSTTKTFKAAPVYSNLDEAPISYPSLCIPRVFSNITWKRVKDAIEDAGWGNVERVDMVRKTNDKGEKFQRVFIHFKEWSSASSELRQGLVDGNTVELSYEDGKPWYWKITASRIARPEPRPRTHQPAQNVKALQQQLREQSKMISQLTKLVSQQTELAATLSKVEPIKVPSGMTAPRVVSYSTPSSPSFSAVTPPAEPTSPVVTQARAPTPPAPKKARKTRKTQVTFTE